MQHEETTTVTVWLEGFEEPLNITVFKSIPQQEFKDLSTEILRNYLLDLKDKGAISKELNDVIIISKVGTGDHRKTCTKYQKLRSIPWTRLRRSSLASVGLNT